MVQRSPDPEAAQLAMVPRAIAPCQLAVRRRITAITLICLLMLLFIPVPAGNAGAVEPTPTIGSGYAWGVNSHGQLAAGSTSDLTAPVAVQLPVGTASVALGRDHALAIIDGRVLAWGRGENGELGNGSTTDSLTPVEVRLPAGVQISSVSGDEGHSLALSTDGRVFAWGRNSSGQLGDGTTTARSLPVAVTIPGNPVITAIGTGRDHSLAVTADGRVYSWGEGAQGQLGTGLFTDQLTPVEIGLPDGIRAAGVAAGIGHSAVLSTDGRILVWGTTPAGTDAVLTPTVIPAVTTAVEVAAGDQHTLALLADGSVIGWGANTLGQLGDGTTDNSQTPVRVLLPAGTTVQSISAAGDHAIALTADGHRVLTWGDQPLPPGPGQSVTDGPSRAAPTFVPLTDGETLLSATAGWFGDLVVAEQGPAKRLVLTPAMIATSIGYAQEYSVRGYDSFGHDLGTLTTGITLNMTGGSCAELVCTPTGSGLQTVTATAAGAGAGGTAQMNVLAAPSAETPTTSSASLSNTGIPLDTASWGTAAIVLVLLGSTIVVFTRRTAGRHR